MSKHDLTCPHCHQVFSVDESEYASLLNQVSRQEIDKEIHEKLATAERERTKEIELVEARVRGELQQSLADKETELARLKSQADQKIAELKAQASEELAKLQAQVASAATERELAVTRAVSAVEKERDDLANKLENKTNEQKHHETK